MNRLLQKAVVPVTANTLWRARMNHPSQIPKMKIGEKCVDILTDRDYDVKYLVPFFVCSKYVSSRNHNRPPLKNMYEC